MRVMGEVGEENARRIGKNEAELAQELGKLLSAKTDRYG